MCSFFGMTIEKLTFGFNIIKTRKNTNSKILQKEKVILKYSNSDFFNISKNRIQASL